MDNRGRLLLPQVSARTRGGFVSPTDMFQCGRFQLPLDWPLLMGVVNVTPDSFSDGGCYRDVDSASAHARRLVDEGAQIIDIGGESTRPGAQPVSEEEELKRVMPVLEILRDLDVPISVDTRRPRVMREVIAAGASMINDIEALTIPGALDVVAASDCAICLMHKKGSPDSMQQNPVYVDVVSEVREYLTSRLQYSRQAGIDLARIAIDVGFGFGKTAAHNIKLLGCLDQFAVLGVPILAGISRKATLGQITGRPVQERVHASIAAALLAVQHGAKILRVHDVGATRDAIAVWREIVEDGRR